MAEALHQRVRIGAQGRVVIPAALRRALNLEQGDEVIARVDDGALILERRERVVARLQARFRGRIPPGVSVVDELIADRLREAELENRG